MAAALWYFWMASGAAGSHGSVDVVGAGASRSPAEEAVNEHLGECAALAALTQWFLLPKAVEKRI